MDHEPNDQGLQDQVSKPTKVNEYVSGKQGNQINDSVAGQPLLNFPVNETPLTSGSTPDDHNESDNLPMVIRNEDEDDPYQKAVSQTIKDLGEFQKDSEQYSEIKNLSAFLEMFVSTTTTPGEVKNLSRLINALRDNHGQLIEVLDSVRNIKKDRRNKDSDRDIFLQEKVSLMLIDRAINENSRFIEILEQIVVRNGENVERTHQIETSTIENPQEREMAENMKADDKPIQEAKMAEYESIINLFVQDKVKLKTIEAMIKAQVGIQEPLIQDEYYRRAEEIKNIFDKSMFNGRSFDDFWLNSKIDRYKEDEIRRILKVQPFDLEDLSQYPDHRLSSLYLTFINAWTKDETGLFVEDNRKKIEETIKLSKDLLRAINPELITEQMKEMVSLLDIGINKDRDFESKKKFILKKSEIELERTTGTKIEVPPLPGYVTPKMLKKMEDKGVELMFDPDLDFGSLEELQRVGVEEYIAKLKQRYPKLHLDLHYWSKVAEGSADFPRLPGKWVAIETMRTFLGEDKKGKNKIAHYYPFIPYDQRELGWRAASELIKNDRSKILGYFGLKGGEVRIPNVCEFFLFDYLGDEGVETFVDNDREDGVLDRCCNELTNEAFFSVKHLWSCGQRYFGGWGIRELYFDRRVVLSNYLSGPPKFRYAIVLPDSMQAAHSKNNGRGGRFRKG